MQPNEIEGHVASERVWKKGEGGMKRGVKEEGCGRDCRLSVLVGDLQINCQNEKWRRCSAIVEKLNPNLRTPNSPQPVLLGNHRYRDIRRNHIIAVRHGRRHVQFHFETGLN